MSHVNITPGPAHDPECQGGPARHHFRVTRPFIYSAFTCPGHTDPAGRDGYYTDACCATQAARIITERLVKRDVSPAIRFESFDVQVWRERPDRP